MKKEKRKTYILDTNVILFNGDCIHDYPDSEVIIPLSVIEELERFKNQLNASGKNARLFIEKLENLRHQGNLLQGIELENQAILRLYLHKLEHQSIPEYFDLSKNSNRVLSASLQLQSENNPLVLVTNDINLRVRASVFGIFAESYENFSVNVEQLYESINELKINPEQFKELDVSDAILWNDKDAYANQYYFVNKGEEAPTLLRFFSKKNKLKPVNEKKIAWNIKPRNLEQLAALDLLLDPKVHIVFLAGKAGTGKTLLALSSGLEQLANNLYQKILVTRPFVPMGRDMGYLPGDINEKMAPWMQPIIDTFEFITSYGKNKYGKLGYHELMEKKILELEALTYIRGRSIPNRFIVIDEAQNLTPHEIKTIITRAGENTKVVLTGDPYQIDNPYVDIYSNGLSFVMEKMKSSELAGHAFLVKGERSPLAELASDIL